MDEIYQARDSSSLPYFDSNQVLSIISWQY